ncbi:MAG: glycyl-radical enzyme activating protein [Candidatus Bipolaricaulota bacterium]|nr:glycyl-radical enzyme activating protein [Candidatus Bipolaricaulota bacterium]MDW8151921.1 glycyl-radical enzyme activating protein [Candidatus Bipolaricaulota bacterium]
MRETGIVFDIQRFSLHDGPGIRTTVFLKGCPLRCLWCHNPEGLSPKPELMFFDYKCLGCGTCARVCPEGALAQGAGAKPRLAREKCAGCGRCAEACPSGAWRLVGRTITVEELLSLLERDALLYDRSQGGVTFSGGEPLFQPDFLHAALAACKERRIHTAVDTSGYAPWDVFERIAPLTDLFLFDLKPMDEEAHRRYTGVSNRLIHANLRRLAELGRPVRVRVPLIPGITDTEENLQALLALLGEVQGRILGVELLPYHDVAEKYQRLGKSYGMPSLSRPSEARLAELRARIAQVVPCA